MNYLAYAVRRRGAFSTSSRQDSSASKLEDLGSIIFSFKFLYYLFGVVAFTAMGFYLCSDIVDISTRVAISSLEVFLVALLIVWLSLTFALHDDEVDALPFVTLPILIFVAPVSCLFLQYAESYQKVAFWATVIVWSLSGSFWSLISEEGESFAEVLIGITGVAWAISSVIISLGTLPILPYATPAISSLRSIHLGLDPRYSLGTIFCASILITALIRAFSTRPPRLRSIVSWKLTDPSTQSILALVMIPFIRIINLFLLIACLLIDFLVKTLRIVYFYFVEIGSNIFEIGRRIMRERPAVIESCIKAIVSFVLIATAILALCWSAPSLIHYLRSSNWRTELAEWPIEVAVVLVLLCVTGISWIMEARDKEYILLAFAIVLSVAFVAGLLVYGLARFDLLYFKGFDYPGPFSVAIIGLIVWGVAKSIRNTL